MSYRKHGLRAAGLCLVAALGLMAFAAASAQASTWSITGQEPITASHEIESELDPDATLVSSVGGTAVKILCKALALTGANIEIEGKSLAHLAFSTCETLLNGVVTSTCKPVEPILTVVKDLLVLHGSTTYDVFEPDTTGKTAEEIAEEKFVVIDLSASCSIGRKFAVKGLLVVKECSPNTIETHLVTHLIEELSGFGSLFNGEGGLPKYAELHFGVNAATLGGSVKLKLKGADAGKSWWGV